MTIPDWTPPVCGVCRNVAIRVAYGVRTFRMVDGRRACASCLCKPDVRWLVRRGLWTLLVEEAM